ncbi:MAG: hypothetical protein MJY54_01400, partial [archaeon]|nr:hypothetical protein [archaeon]
KSHMPTFSYHYIQFSSAFVDSYLKMIEKPEWKKYVLSGLSQSNLYAIVRASRVLYSCKSCFPDLSNISPSTMSEDFKEIFSKISRFILNSYKEYPDAYESDEFIFMILTLVAVNKNLAKEVFDYYVKSQDREKYVKKVIDAGYVMEGFEEVLPIEYLQSKEYHEIIRKYTNGHDTSAYSIID